MLIKLLDKIRFSFQKINLLRAFLIRYRLIIITLAQCHIVLASYAFAFCLRFDFHFPQEYVAIFFKTLPILLVCRLLAYDFFKLNSGWWSFPNIYDLVSISKAVLTGSVIFLIGTVFIHGTIGFPRSVFIIEALLNFFFIAGIRFGMRWYREGYTKPATKQMKNILIVGAGQACSRLLSEIRTNPHLGVRIVGLIDDSPMKEKASIQNVQVLGNCEHIPHLIKEHNIDEIIIAMPSAGYKKISSTVELIKGCGVEAKVFPGLTELFTKTGKDRHLSDFSYSKLLGRPLLKFRREKDLSLLQHEIENSVILITGAGGSIGSELCHQTAKLNPQLLILFERNENNLFHIELEVKKRFPNCKLLPVLGDIRNKNKLNDIFSMYRINLIYHAAAYKHVPMMEREPQEAINNNIRGTKILAELAIAHKVEKFILISSDKAVNPANIMGTTKRICEMLLQGLSGNGTKLISVRFGNVIGSNGSVLPLFKKQILSGGPITVTHPDISRYFMTISEAVQLVMTAGAMGEGGEIFLLDMGTPIKIADLARTLIEQFGLSPEKDIEIEYTGLRPGEKLHEELYWEGENIMQTNNKKITVLRSNGFKKELFFPQLADLERIANTGTTQELVDAFKSIVPEASLETPFETKKISTSNLFPLHHPIEKANVYHKKSKPLR